MKNDRNSNIEFLRIVAICMIVLMHVVGQYQNVDNSFVYHFRIVINSICNVGVTLFCLISGFYGIKMVWPKWFSLANITTFYSIILLAVNYLPPPSLPIHSTIDMPGITPKELFRCVFPIVTNKYWYITAYLILMLAAEPIERMYQASNKRELKSLILSLGMFFCIFPTIFISEILKDNGKGIVNMLLIYLIGRYIRKYGFPQIFMKWHKEIVAGCIFLIISLNEILSIKGIPMLFARDNNLFIIILAITIFCWVINMPFKSNKFVNQLSSFVFPIYIIHFSYMPYVCDLLESSGIPIVCGFFIATMMLFILCVVTELIRRIILDRIFVSTNTFFCKWVQILFNR